MRLQVGELIGTQLKNEIGRKAILIAPYLLIQAACFNAVERGQI